LIFIDQHAAHERILFEKLKGDYETRSILSEKLLMPILIELSAEESFLLGSLGEAFQAMGFDIEAVGERLFALRSIPSIIGQKDPKGVVRAILEELSLLKKEERGVEVIHPILVSLACHTAIRGNAVLRREEMEGLVAQLSPFDRSTTCPHGRPVFFILPGGYNSLAEKSTIKSPVPNMVQGNTSAPERTGGQMQQIHDHWFEYLI
jgi:DNA mismatch repair protein MutL